MARFEDLTRADGRRAHRAASSDRDEVDAANEYARDIPVVVTSRMLGLPRADDEQFHSWTVQMLKDGAEDYRAAPTAVHAIRDYFTRLVTGASGQAGTPGVHQLPAATARPRIPC